jgi:hypothetical protein
LIDRSSARLAILYEKYKEVYVHPRDSGGVLFQLYEGDWEA